MDQAKGKKWDAIVRKLGKEFRATNETQSAYEVLRSKFLEAGGTASLSLRSAKAVKVSMEMQAIEAKLTTLWQPHQKLIGACPKCKGVRIPGTTPKGYGFGCVTCHDFEIFVSMGTFDAKMN